MTAKPRVLVLLEPCLAETDYESKMVPLIKKHLDPKSFSIFVLGSSVGSEAVEGECRKYYSVRHRFTASNDLAFWLEYCWYLFLSFFRLVQVGKSTRTQAIISLSGHAYSGLVVSLAARVLRRKSIVRISDPTRYVTRGRYRFSSLVSTLASIAESCTFRLCYVIVSNRDMSWYHSKVHLKQKVLSQGVDLTLFDSRVMPILDSKAFPKLITVSRLDKHKGISSVIKALKLLEDSFPRIVYHIVGIGPEEKNLREEVKNIGLGDKVIFYGYVKPECIPSMLTSCDVFVLPSLIEGLPSAVLEAMACGVPVILGYTCYDYANWFINEDNAMLVRGEPRTIVHAILRILSDNKLKRRIVFNALRDVRKHHDSSCTKAHFAKIIKELLSNHR